jgi:DNA helicase-2/ATP-dependent DNA helicase PcrA
VVEDAFVAAGVPYHMVGGVRFYARLEVKDILAYLKVLDNPADDVALKRIINTPPRGIGHTTVQRISDLAGEKGVPFFEAMLEAAEGRLLAAGARAKVAAFASELGRYRLLAATLPLGELATAVMQDSGYLARLREAGSEEAQERLGNLQELVTAMQGFDQGEGEKGLASFLEQVALVSDLEQEGEGKKSSVTLMTLHSAKGLEFPVVFMIGMEERLFPHARALDDPVQMEEERRLCYVGMTRAKQRLFLTNVRRRHIFGQEQMNLPARFIRDVPATLIDVGDGFQPQAGSPVASGHTLASLFEEEIEPDFGNEVRMVPEEHGDGVFLGMRVRHAQFGPGIIRKIEGDGDSQKVIVAFASVGFKKLLVRFAGLERD